MKVIYAREMLPNAFNLVAPNTIFLAGPTPRDKDTPSWRPEALEILRRLHFTGTVFVPEDKEWGLSNVIYEEQTRWEIKALARSQSIVFWIPRSLPDMPALTTNTEFGLCLAFVVDRIAFGVPATAVKVKYQKQLAEEASFVHECFTGECLKKPVSVYASLEATLAAAIKMAA